MGGVLGVGGFEKFGEEEEPVGEAVEVDGDVLEARGGVVGFGRAEEGGEGAFDAAADGAGDVREGGGGLAALDDEAAQGREGGFEFEYPGVEAGGVEGLAAVEVESRGLEDGADGEEFALDGGDAFALGFVSRGDEGGDDAEAGAEFVEFAAGDDARVVLPGAGAGDEKGLAVVAELCGNGHDEGAQFNRLCVERVVEK